MQQQGPAGDKHESAYDPGHEEVLIEDLSQIDRGRDFEIQGLLELPRGEPKGRERDRKGRDDEPSFYRVGSPEGDRAGLT